jgi:hypothetical protein
VGALAHLRPPWQPGQSGNPAGRAKGARNKLEERFLADLLKDWEGNGQNALVAAREKDPVGYVKVAASLMPKKVDPEAGLEGITRDELRIAITALQSFIAPRNPDSAGSPVSESGQIDGLQTLPEAGSVPSSG